MLDTVLGLDLTSWLVIASIVTITAYLGLSRRNLPPSPGIALPVIGHLYMMEKNPRNQFLKWSKQLGELFSLQMGSNTVVVLSGYNILKETLVKQADYFSDRPSSILATTALPDGKLGVLFSSGALWKEQRAICISILRDFGMGKNILAEKISEEVSFYISELLKLKGQASNIRMLTAVSVSNNISSIIFGRRFEFEDKRFKKLLGHFDKIVKINSAVAIVNYFPCLQRLPFDVGGATLYKQCYSEVREFCNEFVQEHKQNHDANKHDSFISSYLQEMNQQQQKGQQSSLDEQNLVRVIQNLFAAGTETTSNTIMWFLLYCLHYPDVQEKMHKEIVAEVGLARVPDFLDKPKLKYLNAVIMETLRMSSLAPFSLQHQCREDVVVRGYTIPKGAQIVPHLDSVLKDKKIWGDPEVFRPERFLDNEGNVAKIEEFIPFSLGRRVCLGEALAKMELFLYVSALVQRFKFLSAKSNELPPLKDQFGITCGPESFQIRCVERQMCGETDVRLNVTSVPNICLIGN